MTIPYSLLAALIVALVVGIGFGAYSYTELKKDSAATKTEFASSTAAYEEKIHALTQELAAADAENAALHDQFREENDRNNQYEKQIKALAATVGDLQKLSTTDRELLQKYSKVYFLSENFIPSPLAGIDQQYVYRANDTLQIHEKIKPHLERLLHNAAADSAPLKILSAYRSFGTQANLKTSYKFTYGAGTANQFSADQGYSEHQLGSTIDFTTPQGGEILSVFEKSAGFSWLQQHAHEYGFILSYPKGNTYYQYEPWHWRFVGVELATHLHNQNKNFYDLDQREINTYLVKIFD